MTKSQSTKNLPAKPHSSIWDVASAVHVSVATVSNALTGKGRMSETTRNSVLAAVQQLGYQPTNRGPKSANQRKRITLIIEELPVPPSRDAFVNSIIKGVEQEAQGRQVPVDVLTVSSESVIHNTLPEVVVRRQTRGLIVLGGGDITDKYIEALSFSRLPLVLADNFLYDLPMHCVTIDNLSGGFMATQHLINLGHKRIGVIRGASKYKPLHERYLGYLSALEANNLDILPELIPQRTSSGAMKGFAEMLYLLDLVDPPTAIFATSDKTALNAMRAASIRGVRIPEDLAIIGFDDIAAAQQQNPPLSSVAAPKEELGRVAVNMLFTLLDYPSYPIMRSMLPTELVVRESTGKPIKEPVGF